MNRPSQLLGGDGNDRLSGTGRLLGESGNDTLVGGIAGGDVLEGGIGDLVNGGITNADTLSGGLGNDSIRGNVFLRDLLKESGNVNFTLSDSSLIGLGRDDLRNIVLASLTGGRSNNRINAQ